MQILHYTRLGIKKCDLFSTSQFLRYEGQPDYKTASGGFCSIVVVAVFIGLFMSMAIQTANMQIINWTSTSESTFDPQPTTITIDPKNNQFMFAVSIMGIDLNDVSKRFFDIYLVQHTFRRTQQVLPKKKIPMVPCTQQHFNINSQISQSYGPLKANTWLCPPLGYNYTIQGKISSDNFQNIQVYLGKCHDSTDPSRPCVPNAIINQYMAIMGQFFFGIVYVNPIINAGDSNYLNYYLDDRNFIRFTPTLGAMNTGYVQDYSIVTDVSLMPISQNVKDKGIMIPQLFQSVVFQVTEDNYASFFLFKGSSSVTQQRSFNKIDTFFSYVGGLIGTILGFMFFMNTFTEMTFELDLSQRLFKYKDNDPSNFNSFNLLTYCRFLVYLLLRFFGLCKGWFEMVKYDECKEEMVKQLDIELMINKIHFLERAIEVLFEQDQLYFLHLQQFDSLKKLKKRRRKYETKHKLRNSKEIKDNEANRSESDDKSDEQDKNLEKDNPSDNNPSNYRVDILMNSVANSNVSVKMVDKIGEIQKQNNHNHKYKKKSMKEQFQILLKKIEEGSKVSKKIFDGIDPMYFEGSNEGESLQKIIKEEFGQRKLQMAQMRIKQQEIYIPQKVNFQFIDD